MFRLDIDAAGQIARCTIIASNVDPALDARLCQSLSERGRFRPALNAEGAPVPSTYISSTLWLGKGDPVPLESWARTARIEFDADGRLVGCDIRSEGGASGAHVFMCEDPYRGSSALDDARHRPRIFVRRIEYLVEGQPLTVAGEAPPGRLFAKSVQGMHISAKGEPQDCVLLAEEGATIYPRLCGPDMNYRPLPRGTRAPLGLMRVETIWEVPAGAQ
ncbi:hypothetical protein OF829_10145 [Sphingomonas sp. LB-2]|uniref:hypothetical protein n=1 Tax=Sphingomonas caeni TaxID=2984949 RepID=UPI002230E5E2|nr:hypothetical protein [Sphingomonas caeni]MCW3847604.1 hypothetical protein [Sphingomonas caeni]